MPIINPINLLKYRVVWCAKHRKGTGTASRYFYKLRKNRNYINVDDMMTFTANETIHALIDLEQVKFRV